MSTRAKLILIGAVLTMLLAMAAEAVFANDGDTFTYLPYVGRSRPEPTICPRICIPTPPYVPPTRYPTRTPRPTATATPFINEPPSPMGVSWGGRGG